MINKETTVTIRPARKTRTKTRRPKFLSLRLELSQENTQLSGEMTTAAATHQLNLFPLQPENLVDEKDTHDENVQEYYFFSAADGGATTLTGLLGAGTSSEEENAVSPSLTYACGGQDKESEEKGRRDLVRTALRNRERDSRSEEKWVCYSEVTSCAADLRHKNEVKKRLSLKLDYQEIMDAWSDKGPLYIQLESPQTVPVLHDDCNCTPNGIMDGWGSNGGLWTVPENSFCGNVKMEKEQEQGIGNIGGDQELKTVQREASVLRYKEKRQNRLFSKRIRYEVRKLNAEKRPRMKGRFVKRS